MHKHTYLGLAIAGTVVPVVFFLQHFGVHGLSLTTFVAAGFSNPVAAGLTSDLVISSVAFWVWMFTQRDGPSPWPFMAANLLIGLSLALPLYLWLRATAPAPRGAEA